MSMDWVGRISMVQSSQLITAIKTLTRRHSNALNTRDENDAIMQDYMDEVQRILHDVDDTALLHEIYSFMFRIN